MTKKVTDVILEFPDNQLLQQMVGSDDCFLKYLEKKLDLVISLRGNVIEIFGPNRATHRAQDTLRRLYQWAKGGRVITTAEIDGLLRMNTPNTQSPPSPDASIVTKKATFLPRSPVQSAYMRALQRDNMIFGIGPAGTGKTFLAVAAGTAMLLEGKVDRMILSRPAVEAGERLGFLPGDLKEKVDPYLRPIYDALYTMLPLEMVDKLMENGTIEIAPLAFMRGRTLDNAFVILDEAQNATPMQMKMFMTRLGENSRMVITGDVSQIDLPKGELSGLNDAVDKLKHIPDITFVHLTADDIVRHPLVTKIVHAYDN